MIDKSMPATQVRKLKTEALATWLFVGPSALDDMDAWVQSVGKGPLLRHPDGRESKDVFVTEQEMAAAHDALGSDKVVMLQQCAGDEVHVPPGYVHWVFNRMPCVKFAYDAMRLENLPAYVHAGCTVNSRISNNATDYMYVRACIPMGALNL